MLFYEMMILRLRPAETAESVLDIDYARLRLLGQQAILFDFDGTLAKKGSACMPADSSALLSELAGRGFRLAILTNRRAHRVIANVTVPIIYHARKPRRSGYLSLLRQLEVEPGDCAMIGDRIITDVLGGNRLGMHTVRVRHHPQDHRE